MTQQMLVNVFPHEKVIRMTR